MPTDSLHGLGAKRACCGRPNRSDVHLPVQEEAKSEAKAGEYFDETAPKHHTKPQRSEYSRTPSSPFSFSSPTPLCFFRKEISSCSQSLINGKSWLQQRNSAFSCSLCQPKSSNAVSHVPLFFCNSPPLPSGFLNLGQTRTLVISLFLDSSFFLVNKFKCSSIAILDNQYVKLELRSPLSQV